MRPGDQVWVYVASRYHQWVNVTVLVAGSDEALLEHAEGWRMWRHLVDIRTEEEHTMAMLAG